MAAIDDLIPDDAALPAEAQLKQVLIEQALELLLAEVADNRRRETDTVRRHLTISLNALINRENLKYADLHLRVEAGQINLRPALKRSEDRLEELNHRLETRLADLDKERHCTIADIQHHGWAWVLLHPERKSPGIAPMVRDDEIERRAVEAVIAHENARGWVVESVEKDNRGFDLISRRPHPEDPATAIEVRFIEVKGARRGGRDRVDQQRVQDRRAPEEGLLALRRLQLCRRPEGPPGAGARPARVGTSRHGRALSCGC